MCSTEVTTKAKPVSLIETMAGRWNVEPEKLYSTLKGTVLKPIKRGNEKVPVTQEQFMAFLIVANQYNLNPFVREIYAFPAKDGGIVPVVGVDGWTRIMNDHPQFDGMEFNYSEDMVTPSNSKTRCHEWVECVVHRKDRSQPIIAREYLDECYRESKYESPWQTHPKRFLRHKAMIQGARIAFGFSGIYDQDEAHRIIDAKAIKEKSTEVVDSLNEEFLKEAPKLIEGGEDE